MISKEIWEMVWLLRRGSTEWLEEIGTILEDQQSTKKHATSTIAKPVRTHSEFFQH